MLSVVQEIIGAVLVWWLCIGLNSAFLFFLGGGRQYSNPPVVLQYPSHVLSCITFSQVTFCPKSSRDSKCVKLGMCL